MLKNDRENLGRFYSESISPQMEKCTDRKSPQLQPSLDQMQTKVITIFLPSVFIPEELVVVDPDFIWPFGSRGLTHPFNQLSPPAVVTIVVLDAISSR